MRARARGLTADIRATLLAAKIPPQIVYAYEKTGMMLFAEDLSHCPPDRRREWEDAIDEYFALENAQKGKPIG